MVAGNCRHDFTLQTNGDRVDSAERAFDPTDNLRTDLPRDWKGIYSLPRLIALYHVSKSLVNTNKVNKVKKIVQNKMKIKNNKIAF